jgi:hypothetical protein
MDPTAYYLGTKQKVLGPLSAAEVEALRQNGLIENYSWIWTPESQKWTALDAAPPIPTEKSSTPPSVEPRAVPAPPRQSVPVEVAPAPKPVQNSFQNSFKETRIAKAKNDAYRAILFDGRNAVTAWVSEASAEGCEIRATEHGSDPYFVHKANAMIHLHEVATGRTSKIQVSVSDVFREDHHWVYKVRWTSVPAIFAPSRAA